jgi:hypothetical protein
MIKIFEALQKAQDEISDIVLPAVFEEPGGVAEAASRQRAVPGVAGRSREVAGPMPPADRQIIFEALLPAVFEEPGGAAKAAPRHHAVPGVAGRSREAAEPIPSADRKVRTTGLALSAKDPLFPMEGAAGEQYRIIRTKLMQHPKQPRMIAIVSPGPGDGKTVTSINLAGTLSLKKGAEVLLIDADLRRSKMAEVLGIAPEPGLADLLGRDAHLEDVMVQVEQFPNLYVIPAGKKWFRNHLVASIVVQALEDMKLNICQDFRTNCKPGLAEELAKSLCLTLPGATRSLPALSGCVDGNRKTRMPSAAISTFTERRKNETWDCRSVTVACE